MKRIVTVLSVVAASMLFSAASLLGAEQYSAPYGSSGKEMRTDQKNECLLVAKNCASDTSTVRQRIIELRREIAKGLRVYTEKELHMLREQQRWLESEGHEII